MIVHALRAAGLDPGWLVGGSVGAGLENSHWSEGQWLVVEADESDRSMLSLKVQVAVLTNVELDHHATYSSLRELREAFAELLAGAPQAVIWDRPELLALRTGESVPYDAREVTLTQGGSRFRWRGHEVSLAVPGLHNAVERRRGTGGGPSRGGAATGRDRGALGIPRGRQALSGSREEPARSDAL